MHTPLWGNKPEGFQNEHLKLLWVSLNSMYGPKLPVGDKINPKKYDKPLNPRPPHMHEPKSLSGSFSIPMLKHVTEIWDLRYAYQRIINNQLV